MVTVGWEKEEKMYFVKADSQFEVWHFSMLESNTWDFFYCFYEDTSGLLHH